jgi:hypothetical protein
VEEIVHRKHLILMILGCALPIVALAAVLLFQLQVSGAVLFAIILLCPLSHLLMLGGMGQGHGPSKQHAPEKDHG